MMYNLKRPSLPPGRYWVCDPIYVFKDGEEMHDAFKAGEIKSGIWTHNADGEKFKCAFVDTERGIGCWCFEQTIGRAAEVETGYIGVFPDALIRKMRKITEMKKMGIHSGSIEVVMDDDFCVTLEDYRVDVGHHPLTMVLGE